MSAVNSRYLHLLPFSSSLSRWDDQASRIKLCEKLIALLFFVHIQSYQKTQGGFNARTAIKRAQPDYLYFHLCQVGNINRRRRDRFIFFFCDCSTNRAAAVIRHNQPQTACDTGSA